MPKPSHSYLYVQHVYILLVVQDVLHLPPSQPPSSPKLCSPILIPQCHPTRLPQYSIFCPLKFLHIINLHSPCLTAVCQNTAVHQKHSEHCRTPKHSEHRPLLVKICASSLNWSEEHLTLVLMLPLHHHHSPTCHSQITQLVNQLQISRRVQHENIIHFGTHILITNTLRTTIYTGISASCNLPTTL